MTIRPAYGVSSSGVVDGSITLADLADPGGMPVVRRGAKADGTAGNFVSVNWAPTGTSLRFRAKVAVLEEVGIAVMGRQAGGYYNFGVKDNGALQLRANNTIVATSDAGLVPLGGVSTAVGCLVTPTSVVWEVNYEDVQTQSHSGGAMSTSPSAHYFLARGGASGGINGSMWDVELIDPASATNSAFFPLDGRNAAGEYPNAYAAGGSRDQGSLVGDAVVSGFVEDVVVTSTESGGGGAVRVGGPVVVTALRTSVIGPISGSSGVNFDVNSAGGIDPYGWRVDNNTFSVPVAGLAVFNITGRMRATSVSVSSSPNVRLLETVSSAVIGEQSVTTDTVDEWKAFAITSARVTDGTESFKYQCVSLNTSNVYEFDDIYVTITLYPTTYAS